MAEKKILIVDDDTDTLELLTVILQKENFKVTCASNGWDGMVMAREEKPDLILLDILMPEMQGTDVLHALKAMDSMHAIPIIMLTAHSEKFNVLDAKFTGVADFCVKPFENEVLLNKVRKTLGIAAEIAPADEKTGETNQESRSEPVVEKTNAKKKVKPDGQKEKENEDVVDAALQKKIVKNQYCPAEDNKTSDLQPYHLLMAEELQVGMVLALPLLFANKRPFLSAHTPLTQKHIEKINEKKGELVFPVSVHKNPPPPQST